MLEGVSIIVVVPAFNEAERITRVLASMPREVDRVIVVDDASDDGTGEVARAQGASVHVVRHERNRGVGAAIATGYRHALRAPGHARDAFVVMAGDGQMDPRDLPALATPIARGDAGYVKGNRFAHPERRVMPTTRFIAGHVFSALTSAAIGVDVHDSQCGYTAIAREACEKLELTALWPRFGYPNDLLAMLVRARIPIAEVPVRPVYPHVQNKLRARHVPGIAAVTLRAWIRRRKG
jgi:glycosyltransferase involved in cell wall biosynthesis